MVRLISTVFAAASIVSTVLPGVVAEAPSGTVQYKFQKRYVSSNDDLKTEEGLKRMLSRRQQSKVINAEVSSNLLYYVVNVTVGSDEQPLSLILDTGSSDIWFPDAGSETCQSQPGICAAGSYDRSSSTTYQSTNYPAFEIAYVDGSETTGTYFRDTINIGGTAVQNMTMARASSFSRAIGIMGVAYTAGQSSNSGRNAFTYPNILDEMKSQGYINSLAYSLWLDDKDSDTGSILFGGVDTAKYTGSLVALPIQLDTSSGSYSSLSVAWSGLRVTGSGNNADLSPSAPLAAILDSGTSLTYLPDDIAQALYNGLGVYVINSETNLIPCNIGNQDLNLEFEFGGTDGALITIAVSDLLLELVDRRTGRAPVYQGVTYCQLGIAAAGNYPILFGDTFLRSAYVVYDLENNEIALAQTNFNAQPGEQNVQAFSVSGMIPDATGTATGVSAGQTFTGRPPVGSQTQADIVGPTSTNLNPDATFAMSSRSTATATHTGAASVMIVPDFGPIFAVIGVTLSAIFFGTMLI